MSKEWRYYAASRPKNLEKVLASIFWDKDGVILNDHISK
jgi:hypothetical protein